MAESGYKGALGEEVNTVGRELRDRQIPRMVLTFKMGLPLTRFSDGQDARRHFHKGWPSRAPAGVLGSAAGAD